MTPGDIGSLNIDFLRDDGIAIYVNGVELLRDNLNPTTNLNYSTLATATVSGGSEGTYNDADGIPAPTLVAGTNVLAIEVHNRSTGSSDIGFDVGLIGVPPVNRGGDDPPPERGAGNTTSRMGPLPRMMPRVMRGNSLEFDPTAGQWISPTPDNGGPYHFGDLSGAPSGSALPNNRTTYYARKTFMVTGPDDVDALDVNFIRDDAIAVYLNGTELFRDNLNQGPLSYATLSTNTVGGSSEGTYNLQAGLSANALVAGTNVIAVEVHNASTGSSDIGFDLELVAGGICVTRGPYLQTGAPTRMTVCWKATVAANSGWVKYRKVGETSPPIKVVSTLDAAGTHHADLGTGTQIPLEPNTQYVYEVGYMDGATEITFDGGGDFLRRRFGVLLLYLTRARSCEVDQGLGLG